LGRCKWSWVDFFATNFGRENASPSTAKPFTLSIRYLNARAQILLAPRPTDLNSGMKYLRLDKIVARHWCISGSRNARLGCGTSIQITTKIDLASPRMLEFLSFEQVARSIEDGCSWVINGKKTT